jgi:hypothetical protein
MWRGDPRRPPPSSRCAVTGVRLTASARGRATHASPLRLKTDDPRLKISDPVRAVYLKQLAERAKQVFGNLAAENAIERFSATTTDSTEAALVSFDLQIPAIPEYVLRVARTRKISLSEATSQVRESENARRFRGWCNNVVALAYEGGLRAKRQYEKLFRDFTAVREMWSQDANEGVRYQTRVLKLNDIPLVGKLLSATGMAEVSVKDPILSVDSRFRSFLFLNDLVRAPAAQPTQ